MADETVKSGGGIEKFLPWANLGMQALSFGASAFQAIKATADRKKADRVARRAMEDARRKMEVNFLESLKVPTEPYKRQFRNTVAMSQQGTEALREAGQRAVAGGSQAVSGALLDADAMIRDDMSKALYDRDLRVAREAGRRRDEMADLSLAESEGAQYASRDADRRRAMALGNTVEGFGNLLTAGVGMMPLFKKNRAAQKAGVAGAEYLGGDANIIAGNLGADMTTEQLLEAEQMFRMSNIPISNLDHMQGGMYSAFSTPGNLPSLYRR